MNASRLTPEERSEILLSNIGQSDCGVIALQAITGLKRSTAERLALDHGGYTPESGTPRSGLVSVLSKLGYMLDNLTYADIQGQTTASFAMMNEYGRFLIYIDGHVMALVDGDLFNGRSFYHRPVEQAVRVRDEAVLPVEDRAAVLTEGD